MIGYTSTSKEFGCAFGFASSDPVQGKIPVVFEIEFKSE